jgi:hypothetical protein
VGSTDDLVTGDVAPALSTEEWIQYGANRAVLSDFASDKRPWGPRRRFTYEEKLHAAAAMALYGQSFGFGHDDVAVLLSEASLHERHGTLDDVRRATRLRHLAVRIAALLPPEGVEPERGASGV